MKILRRVYRYFGSDGGSLPWGLGFATLGVVGVVVAVLSDGPVGLRVVAVLELLWPLGLIAAAQHVRPRLLLTSAIGWLLALAISTTATPSDRGVPVGLAIGAGAALLLSLSTRSGVSFEWAPGKTYNQDDDPKPKAETVVLIGTGLLAVVAIVVLAW